MKEHVKTIRNGLRGFNRWAGVLKSDPYDIGLSLSQSSALVDIERFGSLKAQKLTGLLNLDKSSVSRIVALLLSRKLIKVSTDTNDGRAKNLTLTGSGKEMVRKIHQMSDQSVTAVLQHLSPNEVNHIAKAFEKLGHAVDALDKASKL